jgi:tetratricopeptide (TPR) repeat protein
MPELNRAREISPESTVVNALYSLSLRRQGKYQEALAHLTVIAGQEAQEPLWLVEIGNTLVEQGDLIGAREYYEKAVALAPNSGQYWQALARFSVQYNVDARGLGLPAARQAVILAPNDPAALDVMGWTLVNLGDSKTGERFLQQALEREASYPLASLHLAQIYLQRRESADAYFYLKLAAEQDRDNSTAETARRLLKQYFGEGG